MVSVEVDARVRLGQRRLQRPGELFVRVVPGNEADWPIGEFAQRLDILVLVPARPHAEDRLRRPALLDQFARQQHRVVEAADHEERVGVDRLRLGYFDREIERCRIIGDLLGDGVRHVEFRQDMVHRPRDRGAVGVVDMHKHDRLRRSASGGENFLLIIEGVADDHRPGREIPEHELVALLGDLRRSGDIDDERNALLLGDLGDGGGLPGIEGADQELGAVADQLFRSRARCLHVRLGVAVHDREIGQAHRFEDPRRDIDAALAILADAGLQAGTRQQHADLERAALGAHDIERRDAGHQTGGADAGGKSAACEARGIRSGFTIHSEILPCLVRVRLLRRHSARSFRAMMPDLFERSQARKCRVRPRF